MSAHKGTTVPGRSQPEWLSPWARRMNNIRGKLSAYRLQQRASYHCTTYLLHHGASWKLSVTVVDIQQR